MKDYKCDFIPQEDYDASKQKYLYEINIEKENLKINKVNSYNLEWMDKFQKIGRIEAIDIKNNTNFQ